MSDLYNSKNVKIRKQRQCFSCYRKYEIGTIMHYASGRFDGEFFKSYSCLTCKEIMNIHAKKDPHCFSEGIDEGYVHECLDKGQTPEDYLKNLQTLKTK